MILCAEKKFDKRTLLALLSSKHSWFKVSEIPYLNPEVNVSVLMELVTDNALSIKTSGEMLVNRFNQEGATLYEWQGQDFKTA
jgi:hypothetical protein